MDRYGTLKSRDGKARTPSKTDSSRNAPLRTHSGCIR